MPWHASPPGEFGYSWQHWAYKPYGCITGDNAGFFHLEGHSACTTCEGAMEDCLNTEAVREYSRTYPAAVAGRGDYFHFDPETKEATLVYTPDPQVTGGRGAGGRGRWRSRRC